jgi:hypothetical protein
MSNAPMISAQESRDKPSIFIANPPITLLMRDSSLFMLIAEPCQHRYIPHNVVD